MVANIRTNTSVSRGRHPTHLRQWPPSSPFSIWQAMCRSPHAEYFRRQTFLRRRTTRVEQSSWVSNAAFTPAQQVARNMLLVACCRSLIFMNFSKRPVNVMSPQGVLLLVLPSGTAYLVVLRQVVSCSAAGHNPPEPSGRNSDMCSDHLNGPCSLK